MVASTSLRGLRTRLLDRLFGSAAAVPTLLTAILFLILLHVAQVRADNSTTNSTTPTPLFPVPTFSFGVLFSLARPLTDHNGYVLACAALIAMRQINNASGNIEGNYSVPIGPTLITNLTRSIGSKLRMNPIIGDSYNAATNSLSQSMSLAYNSDVIGIVGPSNSFLCVPASYGSNIVSTSSLPLISPSCTTSVLSNKEVHPSFLRVVASDNSQASLIAQLIRTYRWQRFAIIASNEVYGTSILSRISTIAASPAFDMQILASVTVDLSNEVDVLRGLKTLQASGSRVFVIALSNRFEVLFRLGQPLGIFNAPNIFLGTDAIMVNYRSLSVANQALMTGWIGVQPFVDTTSTRYLAFRKAWSEQAPFVDEYARLLPGLPMDIFDAPPTATSAVSAFDISIAFGLACRRIIDSGASLSNVTRARVLAELHNSTFSFRGASKSVISFDVNGDATADYSIVNLQLDPNSTATVAANGTALGVPFQQVSLLTMLAADTNNLTAAQIKILQQNTRFFNSTVRMNLPPDRDPAFIQTLDIVLSCQMNSKYLPLLNKDTCAALLLNSTNTTSSSIASCTGGISRRIAYLNSVRNEIAGGTNTPLLTIDLGGVFFPSPIFDLDNGNLEASWLSSLQVDVFALGLDDWYQGVNATESFFSKLTPTCGVKAVLGVNGTSVNYTQVTTDIMDTFVVGVKNKNCIIASTYTASTSTTLYWSQRLLPFLVKEFDGGFRVGLVSMIRQDFLSVTIVGSTVQFDPSQQTSILQDRIDMLLSTYKVDIVVLLVTFDASNQFLSDLLAQISGVDLICTRTPLAQPQSTFTVTDVDMKTVPVLAILSSSQEFARATLRVDRMAGDILVEQSTFSTINLITGSEEDANFRQQEIAAYKMVLANEAVVIGALPLPLLNEASTLGVPLQPPPSTWTQLQNYYNIRIPGCRTNQCSLGMFLADLLLAQCSSCTVAHFNAGSLRTAGLNAGAITRGDILRLLSFGNYVATYKVTGSDLLPILRHSIILAESVSGGYQQWSGIRFVYAIDFSKTTEADRIQISHVSVLDQSTQSFVPLQLNQLYSIVTIDFLVSGGDNFKMIPTSAVSSTTLNIKFSEMIIQAFRNGLVGGMSTSNTTAIGTAASSSTKSAILQIGDSLIPGMSSPLIPAGASAPCWNSSYELVSDSNNRDAVVWPDEERYCRWMAGVRDALSVCKMYEELASNGTTTADCVCSPTYTRNPTSKLCQSCPKNHLKSLRGDHACICDATHYFLPRYLSKPLVCVDPTGYTTYPEVAYDNTTYCQACQVGCMGCFVNNELSGDALLVKLVNNSAQFHAMEQWNSSWYILPGYWWSLESNIVYQCVNQEKGQPSCSGTWYSNDPCTTGYVGPLCGICDEGYGGFTGHFRCDTCPSYAVSVFLFFISLLAAALLLLFVVYSAFQPKDDTSFMSRILLNHIQIASFIGSLRVADGNILRSLGRVLGVSNTGSSRTLAYKCLFRITALSHMQWSTVIVGIMLVGIFGSLIARAIRKAYAKHQRKKALKELRAQNPNAPAIPELDDDDVYIEKGIIKVVDATVFLFGCCFPQAELRRRSSSVTAPPGSVVQIWKPEQRLLPVCVVILLFIYPSIMLDDLNFMRPCLVIDGVSYMADDLSVQCNTNEFRIWWIVALLRLLFIGLGTPFMILVRLGQHQKRLRFKMRAKDIRARITRLAQYNRGSVDAASIIAANSEETASIESPSVDSGAASPESAHTTLWKNGIPTHLSSSISAPIRSKGQAARHGSRAAARLNRIKITRTESQQDLELQSMAESSSFFLRYRFLIEGYINGAWFWEVVIMTRKMLLILVLVFCSQDPTTQANLALVILVLSLLLHIWRRPYRERIGHLRELGLDESFTPKSVSEDDSSDGGDNEAGRNSSDSVTMRKNPSLRNATAGLGSTMRLSQAIPLEKSLNLLESVSLCILIFAVCASSLSHADVLSGRNPTNDLTLHQQEIFIAAQNPVPLDSGIQVKQVQAEIDPSPSSLVLDWVVVILHCLFVLGVLYRGWPEVRKISWWRSTIARWSDAIRFCCRGSMTFSEYVPSAEEKKKTEEAAAASAAKQNMKEDEVEMTKIPHPTIAKLKGVEPEDGNTADTEPLASPSATSASSHFVIAAPSTASSGASNPSPKFVPNPNVPSTPSPKLASSPSPKLSAIRIDVKAESPRLRFSPTPSYDPPAELKNPSPLNSPVLKPGILKQPSVEIMSLATVEEETPSASPRTSVDEGWKHRTASISNPAAMTVPLTVIEESRSSSASVSGETPLVSPSRTRIASLTDIFPRFNAYSALFPTHTPSPTVESPRDENASSSPPPSAAAVLAESSSSSSSSLSSGISIAPIGASSSTVVSSPQPLHTRNTLLTGESASQFTQRLQTRLKISKNHLSPTRVAPTSQLLPLRSTTTHSTAL